MGSLRKKGDRWYFSVELPSENGKRRRVERAGGKTKKEAQQKMKEFEAEILTNGYKEKNNMTFSELFDIWYEQHVLNNCSFSTQRSYKTITKANLIPRIGSKKVVDIKAKDINNLFLDLKKEKFTQSLFKMLKSVLNSCFDYALFPLEIIDNNPCRNVKNPKMEVIKDEKDIIDFEKLNRIVEVDAKHYMFPDVCIFLFNTGMRIGEAFALRWEDIDFENRIIHIKHNLVYKPHEGYFISDTKSKSSVRDILFNNTVEKLLRKVKLEQNQNKLRYGKYYKNNNLVFSRINGYFLSEGSFVTYAKKTSIETGINFTMHTFRHSHATIMLQSGANMKDVQDRLGHSTIGTTMNIYVQSTEESKKEALKKFDEYIKTSDI